MEQERGNQMKALIVILLYILIQNLQSIEVKNVHSSKEKDVRKNYV